MKYFKIILLALICGVWLKTSARVQFTNIKCISLDKNFTDFEYCYIKAVNRSYKYISLKVKLLKIPITNVTLNLAVYKKESGFKPFLYNVTQDGCKFLKNRRSNLVFKFMAEIFLPYSNMNHECPFDHDLLLDKLPVSYVDNSLTKILPMPRGEYRFSSVWMAYNIPRVTVNIYVSLA